MAEHGPTHFSKIGAGLRISQHPYPDEAQKISDRIFDAGGRAAAVIAELRKKRIAGPDLDADVFLELDKGWSSVGEIVTANTTVPKRRIAETEEKLSRLELPLPGTPELRAEIRAALRAKFPTEQDRVMFVRAGTFDALTLAALQETSSVQVPNFPDELAPVPGDLVREKIRQHYERTQPDRVKELRDLEMHVYVITEIGDSVRRDLLALLPTSRIDADGKLIVAPLRQRA
jgi:hypothetical protein